MLTRNTDIVKQVSCRPPAATDAVRVQAPTGESCERPGGTRDRRINVLLLCWPQISCFWAGFSFIVHAN
jgi:hypothetical protein